MTFLKLFDVANVEECYRRSVSVVPQQALALANSPLALEKSRLLAGKLLEAGADDGEFVKRAFVRLLGRPPDPQETLACLEFLDTQSRLLADTQQLEQFTTGPAANVKPAAEPSRRAKENLVHVLMNHNEFVTIR
jgi:hypothetical protein